MSQPAPDWSQTSAPAPLEPPPAPASPAAPLAPPPPGSDGGPVVVKLPTDAGAMLDAGMALQHAVSPVSPVSPYAAQSPVAAAPEGQLTSQAMPPAAAWSGANEPTARDDVAAAALPATRASAAATPTVQLWWSPGTALVLAMAAVTWQVVSYYARVQLPLVEASGGQLTYFDLGVRSLPLAGSAFGVVPGLMMAVAAVGILVYGGRRGLRDPALQLIVGMLAAGAIVLASLLPMIAA
jgi:hypothetical protein